MNVVAFPVDVVVVLMVSWEVLVVLLADMDLEVARRLIFSSRMRARLASDRFIDAASFCSTSRSSWAMVSLSFRALGSRGSKKNDEVDAVIIDEEEEVEARVLVAWKLSKLSVKGNNSIALLPSLSPASSSSQKVSGEKSSSISSPMVSSV